MPVKRRKLSCEGEGMGLVVFHHDATILREKMVSVAAVEKIISCWSAEENGKVKAYRMRSG